MEEEREEEIRREIEGLRREVQSIGGGPGWGGAILLYFLVSLIIVGGLVAGFAMWGLPPFLRTAPTVELRQLKEDLKNTKEKLGGPFSGNGWLDSLVNRVFDLEAKANKPEVKAEGEAAPAPEAAPAKEEGEEEGTKSAAPSPEDERAKRIKALRE